MKKFPYIVRYATNGRKGIWNTQDGKWRVKPTIGVSFIHKKMDELYEDWKKKHGNS